MRQRITGYREALEAAGIEYDPSLLSTGTRDVAERPRRRRPPARAPRRAPPDRAVHRQQPQHDRRPARARRRARPVALAGFDDFELADLLGTTVVRADPWKLGEQGAALAFARLDGDERPPLTVTIPTELVTRGSGERSTVKPLNLPPNQFHRFYKGGARIDALRGVPEGEDGRPEDWVGSTATSWGSETEGLSRLEDGTVLKDAIDADPEAFLGPDHVAHYGADPALLVKLLDAGERLPVHYHPGRPFAKEHLGLRYGKTESWLILEAEPGAAVHVGLKEPLDPQTARALGRRAGRRRDARTPSTRSRSRPATASSSPPARCTRSAAGSCCSSCRSRPTCRCSSSGSASASTAAPSTSSSAGTPRCSRSTASRSTPPR